MKSCLASYCGAHLTPHLTAPLPKRHQLTDPRRTCSGGCAPLELFCKTDQICVCMLCPVLDHKAHKVIPRVKSYRIILERRLKILEINQAAKLGKEAVDRELEDGVQVFIALIQSLERTQAELIGTIEATQKMAEQRPEGFVHQLDQEISELIRKSGEVKQLSRSKDHLPFLQSFASLKRSPSSRHLWRAQ